MSTDAHGSVELAAPEKATKADHASTEDGVASTTIIDPEKERRIIRKFDMLVLPQFVLMIILAYLDRTNIGTQLRIGPSPCIASSFIHDYMYLLTPEYRQRTHLWLRRVPQPQGQRLLQPQLALLRHLRRLRDPLGPRRQALRRQQRHRHRHCRLERHHHRHGLRPQLQRGRRLPPGSGIRRGRCLPGHHLPARHHLPQAQPGKASGCHLRCHGHLWCLWRPDCLWHPENGQPSWH